MSYQVTCEKTGIWVASYHLVKKQRSFVKRRPKDEETAYIHCWQYRSKLLTFLPAPCNPSTMCAVKRCDIQHGPGLERTNKDWSKMPTFLHSCVQLTGLFSKGWIWWWKNFSTWSEICWKDTDFDYWRNRMLRIFWNWWFLCVCVVWPPGDTFCIMERTEGSTHGIFLLVWAFPQDSHLENCQML